MEKIGRYQQITPLSNKNAGSSKWCFGKYNGKEYFIKEYLSPKYPQDDSVISPEKIQRKKNECFDFERKKIMAFHSISTYSDGNTVPVEEFFRVGSKYYIATTKVDSVDVTEEDIAAFDDKVKYRLCAIIAHSLIGIHTEKFVHGDIKHTNIMFTNSKSGYITAKLIDFDAGFFEQDQPVVAEQIAGDQVYYSPEVCNAIINNEISISCKSDIFSLGILFHQYFTGKLPLYNEEEFSCVGEAVVYNGQVELSDSLSDNCRELIISMLDIDPVKRPSAQEVHSRLLSFIKSDNTGFVKDDCGKHGWYSL